MFNVKRDLSLPAFDKAEVEVSLELKSAQHLLPEQVTRLHQLNASVERDEQELKRIERELAAPEGPPPIPLVGLGETRFIDLFGSVKDRNMLNEQAKLLTGRLSVAKDEIVRIRESATSKHVDYPWRIHLTINGPDNRYNPGTATISECYFSKFLESLESAVSTGKALRAHAMSDNLETSISSPRSTFIKVISTNGRSTIQVGVPSTSFIFYSDLTIIEAESLLVKLRSIGSIVDPMVQTLAAINSEKIAQFLGTFPGIGLAPTIGGHSV